MRIAYSVLLLLLPALASPPVVTNVRFEQRANSNLVDIYYDLTDADGDSEFAVTFDVSTDGGSTWSIKPERWSGAAGSGVKAGKGKKITWDALGDCGKLRSDDVVVRVKADDGRIARKPTADSPQPTAPSHTVPSGMTFLKTNSQGYEEYRWEKDGSTVIKIPAGTFTMGSTENTDEKPVHQVHLDEYYIDKYEVTNRQYKQFCDATGRSYPSDPGFSGMSGYFSNYSDYPVVNVSWDDAAAYCTWAGKRLPTEAEWEKAARGTDSRKYPWGNSELTGRTCNFADKSTDYSWSDKSWNDGHAYTAPVGNYQDGASPYGCMDMAGNVWEWCADWYDISYYGRSPGSNPTGPSSGSARVGRGGSWLNDAWLMRCASRIRLAPSTRYGNLGFRCAGGR